MPVLVKSRNPEAGELRDLAERRARLVLRRSRLAALVAPRQRLKATAPAASALKRSNDESLRSHLR